MFFFSILSFSFSFSSSLSHDKTLDTSSNLKLQVETFLFVENNLRDVDQSSQQVFISNFYQYHIVNLYHYHQQKS